MKKRLIDSNPDEYLPIDILIDGITPCLIHCSSGEHYNTIYSPLEKSDLKHMVVGNKEWNFDWKKELSITNRQVIKLCVVGSD
ncbi:MAG: hypothetical protein WD512_18110, partial [Candidatus Paceibacterota bacterium]